MTSLTYRDGTTRTMPPRSLPSGDSVQFRHPGYPRPNLLFSLPCVDLGSNGYGVHHQTALTACQIVANNAFDGFLTLDADGYQTVDDDVLTNVQYYFIVPGNKRYPVVPSFSDWHFPQLPSDWKIKSQKEKDTKCEITGVPWTTNAHIIPKSQAEWYSANEMAGYAKEPPSDIDCPKNLIPLSFDLHYLLDRFIFSIVPKSTPTGPAFCVHALSHDQPIFANLYHDVVLDLPGVVPEYLFARFALAILIRIKPFLTAGPIRDIVQYVRDERKNATYNIKELDGSALNNKYGGGGTSSTSPKKRKQAAEGGGAADEAETDDYDETDDASEPPSPPPFDPTWEPRGRTLKRRRGDDRVVPALTGRLGD